MKNSRSKLITYVMAFVLAFGSLSISTSASAAEYEAFNTKPRTGDILLDLLVMRPVMMVATVVGAATFLVSLPFSTLGGNVDESANTLVKEPIQYTFYRPLGDI